MKSIKILSLFIMMVFLLSCRSSKVYQPPITEGISVSVKKIAILPFVVSIDAKRLPKGMNVDAIKVASIQTAYDMQNTAYTWLLKREKVYTVKFQDVDKTNALLNKQGINFEDIVLKDKAELCRILGVDAVLTAKAMISKPMSEGGAMAKYILTGSSGSTNKTVLSASLYNAHDVLIWKYDTKGEGKLKSDAEEVNNKIIKRLSVKLPYRKK